MTVKYLLDLYAVLIRSSIRSRMQYRMNFMLGTLLAALIQIAEFLMIAIILNKFGAVKGWSLHEVGYLFAVMTLSKTLYRAFANDVHHLEKYLTTGELDQLLTRPVPILLALMSQNVRLMPAEILQGGGRPVLVAARLDVCGADYMDGRAVYPAGDRYRRRDPVRDRACDRYGRLLDDADQRAADADGRRLANGGTLPACAVPALASFFPACRHSRRFCQLCPLLVHFTGRIRGLADVGHRAACRPRIGAGIEVLEVRTFSLSKHGKLGKRRSDHGSND